MKIEWVKKVYSAGRHNAFTSLVCHQGKYYLAFRSAAGHEADEAEQVIMTSDNGEEWAVAHKRCFVGAAGATVDYRDSSFVSCGDRLFLYSFCTLVVDGARQKSYLQVQILSAGSRQWSEPCILQCDSILWKPSAIGNRFYSVGYSCRDRQELTDLFQSDDGLNWEKVGPLAPGSEACLHSFQKDKLTAFVRTETPPYHLEIFESEKPFTEWNKIAEVPQIIQCPHVIEFGGRVLLIGRYRPDYMKTADKNKPSYSLHRTKIWEFKNNRFSEVLELPSMGDNAYAGTALMPDGSLLVSYYSQHETSVAGKWEKEMPADIFVAKINP